MSGAAYKTLGRQGYFATIPLISGGYLMLNKKLIVVALVMAFPVGVMAAGAAAPDASGGCGVGSKLFENQRGVAPQVLAMTTNGMLGQIFAVSSRSEEHTSE